jgi:molybdopterin converting factor small subunit
MIRVELFGVPRLRARTGCLEVEAASVGEALRALAGACPALDGTVIHGRGVHPAYRLNLNGERFVESAEMPLNDGDTLLLLAADVGG